MKVPVRPSSVDKPSVVELRNKGVAIIPVDLATASSEHLQEILRGANTVICSLVYTQLGLQHKIIEAAKAVGVPRFVPCDFGTPGRRGVRKLHDEVRIRLSGTDSADSLVSSEYSPLSTTSETGHTGCCEG